MPRRVPSRDRRPVQSQAPEDARTCTAAIDPELLKEEADRRSLTPEVAPNLNLPEQDSVLALDYFQGDARAGAAGAVRWAAEPHHRAQHSEAEHQSAFGVT